MHAIHCDSTTVGRLVFLAAIAATVMLTPASRDVADTETYIACRADVHDADTTPAFCVVVGEEVQPGAELADLSTAAERRELALAQTAVDALSLTDDETGLAAAKRALQVATERVRSRIMVADRAGNIESIHARRSSRTQSDYFSIVYYSRSR